MTLLMTKFEGGPGLARSVLIFGAAMAVLNGCQGSGNMKQPPVPVLNPQGGVDDGTLFFGNTNNAALQNNAQKPSFNITPEYPSEPCSIYTYHWNGGAGKAPGKTSPINTTQQIVYGLYTATPSPGKGVHPTTIGRSI